MFVVVAPPSRKKIMKAPRKIDSCIHTIAKRIPNQNHVLIHILCPSVLVPILMHICKGVLVSTLVPSTIATASDISKNTYFLAAANCRVSAHLSQITCIETGSNECSDPKLDSIDECSGHNSNLRIKILHYAVLRRNISVIATMPCGLTIRQLRWHDQGCPVDDGVSPWDQIWTL